MLRAIILLLLLLPTLQEAGQIEKILERGDKLLEEAKTAYEEAREKASSAGFIDAGFKLEDARIKYIVLQEIGSPEKQKIAAERLRSVNQLAKLIHDGKVAVTGAPADPKPAEPPPPTPGELAKPAPAPVKVDVSKRSPVPDAAKLKDAEKLIKDLYKEQYAKKTQADRKSLGRLFLVEAPKNRNDQMVFWVLCREAQDQAVQGCDLPTAMKAIDTAGEVFDIDGMALRNAALAATSKTAKTPEEFGGVVAASFKTIDELVANDQYDAADKLAQAMMPLAKKGGNLLLFTQMSGRAKDVADAKGLYQGMKGVLETLAKTPDDPPANAEMGKFLCFVKGNWDLGLRFIAKGPEGPLKGLGAKEMANPESAAERSGIADGWAELGDKEKSGLRRIQLLNHALAIYDSALESATGLMHTKIEKQMTEIAAKLGPAAGVPIAVDLLPLVDPKKDSFSGKWEVVDGKVRPVEGGFARIEVPYEPADEYNLKAVIEAGANTETVLLLSRAGHGFALSLYPGQSRGAIYSALPDAPIGAGIPADRPFTVLVQVRLDSIKAFLDGKQILDWKPDQDKLGPHVAWRPRNQKALGFGANGQKVAFTSLRITELSGKGKKLR
jgi:hypothetical protein